MMLMSNTKKDTYTDIHMHIHKSAAKIIEIAMPGWTTKSTHMPNHTYTLSCRRNQWDSDAAMTKDNKKDMNKQTRRQKERDSGAAGRI